MAASTRNCPTISRRGAPMDFLMPISRVRSVTVTSMMFMIPIPPTSRAMPAMPPSTTLMEVISSVLSLMAELPFSSSYSPTLVSMVSPRKRSSFAITVSMWSD